MHFNPNTILGLMSPSKMLHMPVFNIIFGAGHGGHIGRLRDRAIVFTMARHASGPRDGQLITTAAWIADNLNNLDISNAINRFADHILTGKMAVPTPANAIHEAFTANPRILKGAVISEYVNNPLRGMEQHINILVARSGIAGAPHSVILYIWHMTLTLLHKRVIEYVAPSYEFTIPVVLWPAFVRYAYTSPFRSNNTISHDDVESQLKSAQMPDQMDGRNLESWQLLMIQVLTTITNINEDDYTAQAYMYVPEDEVWYIPGNIQAYVFTGDRVTIGVDTFKYSKVEATAHFANFSKSVFLGFKEEFTYSGLQQEATAKTKVTITKQDVPITGTFGVVGMNNHLPFMRAVPVHSNYYHPRNWFFQKISDGKDLLYVRLLTNNQLREGLLKIKIDSVQSRLQTIASQFNVVIPALELPYMGDDTSVLYEPNGQPRDMLIPLIAHPGFEINTTVSIPIERPVFTGMFVDIDEVPSNWIFDETIANILPDFVDPVTGEVHYNECRAIYGVNIDTLKRILNYYITSYIAITALDPTGVPGHGYVNGNDLDPGEESEVGYETLPYPFEHWRDKVVHQNLVDFIIHVINESNY